MAEEAREFLKSNLKQMAESERAYALRMAEHQRNQKLPPIENGTVVVFKLQKYPAVDAARTLSSLLGAQPVRLAVDERTNSLIAFGKQETLPAVEELVRRLDEQDDASSDSQGTSKAKNSDEASRSLLVRVFWLADGVSADDGQDPAAFLPNSVLDATERLGLSNPRLVTQTVNSLAVKGDESIPFSTSVPALVGEAPVGLNCKGEVQLIGDDRAGVNVRIEVSGPISCSLSGSLASPLGHYMVLGTANSVISDAAQGAAMMDGPGMGMEGGMGRGGYGGEGRRGRGGMRGYGGEDGGYGGEMGIRSGKGEGVEGGTGMEGEAPASPAEQKYTTSRFAFVVQVIEGQSYPGEASTTDAHATETESGDDPIGRK